ncbi:hypothetical protein Cgig2_000162 [Carnegiea gigantea]|uniref:Reverse transcriptase n=1 Tax=Carnegiea gigantea TaxID=171969 RepID=A0A9Q1JRT0_9CARY|nr:hypothetical protein Cgig2_000162 [Carnegiea gigantea]
MSTHKSARLDQVLCNVAWRQKFQEGGMRHLVRLQSDHAPILISTKGSTPRLERVKPFRFQAAWMLHSDCGHQIRKNWRTTAQFHITLRDQAAHLNTWNKETFDPEALWARVLRHKYCKARLDLECPKIYCNPSNLWKGVCENRAILQKVASHTIEDGQCTLFWLHKWAMIKPLMELTNRPVSSAEQSKKVAEY